MKAKPFYRKKKDVVGLTHWIEKIEVVFEISFCVEDCKLKFATCTLADAALTRWNSYVNKI